ncbi:hypothetical protein NIES4073_11420 [Kalymmatonema gypsitolerans NIES-4073]|nr:hypothetical protein NIES4073_11420 [Scytonema sp. NIES-4073]
MFQSPTKNVESVGVSTTTPARESVTVAGTVHYFNAYSQETEYLVVLGCLFLNFEFCRCPEGSFPEGILNC